MSESHFDHIAQEILKQKQVKDKLEAENRELRQQIADLRSGRGIFVDMNGIRFALRDDASSMQTTSSSSVPASTSTVAPPTAVVAVADKQQIVDAPTAEIAEVKPQTQEQSVKKQMSPVKNDADKKSTDGKSTFLEEIMIDEFNNALTSPNAVWQDPAEKKQAKQPSKPQDPINEEQKAALRRELSGSYLLE